MQGFPSRVARVRHPSIGPVLFLFCLPGPPMTFLDNIKIGKRLFMAFGGVCTLLVGIALVAYFGIVRLGDQVNLITDEDYPQLKLTAVITKAVNQQARSARNLIIVNDRAQRDGERQKIEAQLPVIGAAFDKLVPMVNREEGKQLLAVAIEKRQAYLVQLKAFLEASKSDDVEAARTLLLGAVRVPQLEYMKQLEAFSDFQEKQMDEAAIEADVITEQALRTITVAGIAAVLFAVAAGVLLGRSITRPVAEAVTVLDRVAQGDLTHDLVVTRRDEMGDLLRAVDQSTRSLRTVVVGVRQGVDSVSTAAGQIAAGNLDLSSRTEQQAGALQQTASSMEQMTSTVAESANAARQAAELAQTASDAAGKGAQVVSDVVGTMSEISDSSKRISDITGVIDGIAFQTNILALNAAVEAARAGEHGRGFAVVATEVRALAQRSAAAAKEIKQLIGTSVEKVEAGSERVGAAGTTMRDIVSQVARVTQLINEISSAATEQSAGIGQMSSAVSHMDQATQQNAALVEEGAAAAQSLNDQARTLLQTVEVFRV
ncbi:methyl-accepting chemotaxis protein [Roseateles amylovorans]|uniref:methyl-accepting chemotaxis protein n=1 Tax=Roseateles amylovorans TaxID=2978473 RepID=UPI0025B6DD33|nr:methyl-accepting chemotaxis protein [Roseateles amylovorans]